MKKVLTVGVVSLVFASIANADVVQTGWDGLDNWDSSQFTTFDVPTASRAGSMNVTDVATEGELTGGAYSQTFVWDQDNSTVNNIQFWTYSSYVGDTLVIDILDSSDAQITRIYADMVTAAGADVINIALTGDDMFALTKGDSYIMEMRGLDGDGATGEYVIRPNYADNLYADGNGISSGGSVYSTRDFGISMQAIPEPATMGLIAFMGVGALVVRRFFMM